MIYSKEIQDELYEVVNDLVHGLRQGAIDQYDLAVAEDILAKIKQSDKDKLIEKGVIPDGRNQENSRSTKY